MSTTRWVKVYKGPFSKEEALKHARSLRETMTTAYEIRVRYRKDGQCDVWAKINKNSDERQ